MEALLERLAPYGDSKDADILWRLARACYKVAKLPKTQSKDSKKLAEDALLFINKALELDDSNFACFEVGRMAWLVIITIPERLLPLVVGGD